jgi:flagellar biosynthesis regulator FlaF
MGFVSLFAAYLMWKNNYRANNMITLILSLHFLVLVYLNFISDTAAHESQMAMVFRTIVWFTIAIFFIQIPKLLNKKDKTEK